MEFPELYGLLDHWSKYPPPHLAMARLEAVLCAGLQVKTAPTRKTNNPSTRRALDPAYVEAFANQINMHSHGMVTHGQ